MKNQLKKLILIAIVLFFIGGIGFYIHDDSKWRTMYFPSPTNEYTVEMRFRSRFLSAYYGDFYLIAEGERYYINDTAPGSCKWISDKEFTTGSHGSYSGIQQYHVDNILSQNNNACTIMCV